ncbi:MAG: SprT-like domain-containing protein [Candidatus Helarchaeota archaeon]
MITKTIVELERLFDLLNQEFFEAKLINPIIIVQRKVKKNTLGTCSTNPVWLNRKNEDKDKRYEITLSGEYLNRSNEEIIATLLHEMIPLYCSQNDIKDTSNNSIYHNKKFKEEAEKRGLIIEKAKTIGWSVTKLNDKTKKLILKFKIDDSAFNYYRKSLIEVPKKKTIIYKYTCPDCGQKISHYKEVNLICGDCNKPYEKREE